MYPQDATAIQDKCAIRKRAKQYRVQYGQLYRVICSDSKNGDALYLYKKDTKARMQIINGCHIGLAKVATERLQRLRKSISGQDYRRM